MSNSIPVSKPSPDSVPTPQKRESRHIQVQGIQPQFVPNARIHTLFSAYGRVQKLEWQSDANSAPFLVISFRDRPSAMNAVAAKDLQIEGKSLVVSFYEAKNAAHAAQHTPSAVQSTQSTFAPSSTGHLPTSETAPSLENTNSQLDTASITAHSGGQRRPSQTTSLNRQLQGIAVSQLPSKIAEAALKQQLTDILTASRVKCKLINVSFEQAGDATRALLLLQDVSDMDLLIAEINQQSLPSLSSHQRLKARSVSQNVVTDAYNTYMASRNNPSLSRADSTSSTTSASAKVPDPRQKDACRTLYVGNLEKYNKEEWLRAKFSEFGHILEVDIKNRDSFSPFAFIQFTNIESVVKAIIANQTNKQTAAGQRNERTKLKLNFGKAIIPSTRVWIGALPASCSQEYLFFRLRNISPDGVQEVDYDSTNHEALVTFKNIEQAQSVYNKIKSRQFVVPPEKPQKDSQTYIHHVDFASEKLYDFFSDRKHGRYRTASLIATGTESPSSSHQSKKTDPTKKGLSRERTSLVDSSSNESLLAPPPDPPKNLQPSVDEAEPMSSRHNRRSSPRRPSPDQTRHRRDWDRERYERRSDSRSYSSRKYREKRRKEKKRHESRHHHRSQSSSSSSSASSDSSRSSVTTSASTLSHNSTKSVPKMQQQKEKLSTSLSPTIQSPAILSGILAHPPFNQPPPIPPTKNLSTSAALKRSDAVDSTFPPSTSSLNVKSPDKTKSTTSQTTVQQKKNIHPPKSAPTGSNSKPDFKTSNNGTQLYHQYRNSFTRITTLSLKTEPDRYQTDPRSSNENYRVYIATDREPPIYFPSFYLDDEMGKQYCQRMQTLSLQRRNSQSSSSGTTPAWQKSDSVPHPPISRSNSGSDHSKTPAPDNMSFGLPGFDMPLVPPYPPPPLGTPLESPGPIETRQRSDSAADTNYFTERLQSISSKVSSLTGRSSTQVPFSAPPQQKPTTFEEDLQRFQMKLSSVTKPTDSSQPTTPVSTVKPSTTPSSRLTINIPTSTSSSSTPIVGSPALHSQQPTPSSATSVSNSGGRSMSFSQQNNPMTSETLPATSTGLGPRSSSYNFASSNTNTLPLPPQPPTNLSLASPRAEKTVSPKTSTTVKTPSIASPSLTPTTASSTHPKSESTPTLTIKQTSISKSAVTSPLTTPSTPRSASSLNESKTPVPSHRDSIDSTEEAKRKRQNEKIKLFQSIKVPKKPRDQNPTEEIFSFSSPLSRIPHVQTPGAQPTPTPLIKTFTAQHKSSEKPAVKPQPNNVPPINRASTQSNLLKHEKKDKRSLDEKEKLKPSKSSTMLLTKTDSKGHKSSVLATLSEKDRRNSETLIENEMKRIQEKAARKFPSEEKEREKYVRKKQEKLRQRAEEIVLRQKEKQKEAGKKMPDDAQKKMSKKLSEHKPTTHFSKTIFKESSKEKELKLAKEKLKEKPKEHSRESKESVERAKQKTQHKKRQRTPSESQSGSDDESEEDNSEILAECGLRQSDLEMQRILFEEAKAGQLNLSMYERVRRRRQATTQPEENKKSHALELLREGKKKEKKPKRVQLSSDDESDAANSHKQSKASASENSDSEHSEASTAASSSSALKAKKLKAEFKKKEKLDKRKKSDKLPIGKKLSLKKMIKKETESSEDESSEEAALKKLKKNLSAYNNESDDSDNEPIISGRGRPKKSIISKLKTKKSTSTMLGDDDFGDSDEDKRSEIKKESVSFVHGLADPSAKRSTDSSRTTTQKPRKPGRPRKDEHKLKDQVKKQSKKSKPMEGSDEPTKKKPKISTGITAVKTEVPEEKEKKRRASSEIENVPTTKRPKPEQILTTTMAKMSPTIEKFSPTQSTAIDSVRLENFVTQSCEPKEHKPLISSLASGRFGPTSTEGADSPADLKRPRTSSSSSSTGSTSGSSTCSSTSAATSTTKKSTLSRQHSDTSSKTAETTAKLGTFQVVKAVDENSTILSSVEPKQIVEDKEPPKEPSPLRLSDELQFEESVVQSPSAGNQEDSDEDYEAMLVQQLDEKEAPPKGGEKTEEPVVVERSQETEDAVESLSAFMNANQPRSEDEEDEAFTLITRGNRLSRSSTQSTQLLSPKIEQTGNQDTFTPTVLSKTAATLVQQKENSPQQHVCPPDPAPTVNKAESSFASGKASPISSVVQSIAHGTSLSVDSVPTTSAPITEQKQPVVASVASAIPSHLPTPPPSRSSGGSPVTQVQYPARQQSPLVVSKSVQPAVSAQPLTETAQKRLSDGTVQPTTAQQQPAQDFSITQQTPQRLGELNSQLIGGMQLPPNLSQLQQQIMAQRSGATMDEREYAAFANELAKKQQFMQMAQPTTNATSLQMPFPQPTQQRSRAGSQSTVGTPASLQQRQVGAITTVSSSPQQFVANRNIATTATQPLNTALSQSAITTNPQSMVSPTGNQLDAFIGPLSQLLSMNPAINNTIVMQQLLNSPQFLSQLPHLAANPQMLEMVLRQYQLPQINQQPVDIDKFLKSAIQMVGPNASQETIQQTMYTLMQQEQRRLQEQELAEKQKQLMFSQYENAMRGNRVFAEDLSRQQQRAAVNQPSIVQGVAKQSSHLDVNRYPICWQGNLALKSSGTTVQMHLVSGNQLLIEITANELASLGQDGFATLRINQRMKLQNSQMQAVCNKMNDQNEFVALICLPCGQNAEQVVQQTVNMTSNFIDYFTAKMAAGVVTRGGMHAPHPTCVAHVFPPCDFSAQQLRRLAPDLFEKVEKFRSTYLFVVVTRNDANSILQDAEKVHHLLPTMIAHHAIGKTL